MSLVTASTRIAVPPAEVWNMVMDPHRLADWVTIHRRLCVPTTALREWDMRWTSASTCAA